MHRNFGIPPRIETDRDDPTFVLVAIMGAVGLICLLALVAP